MSRALLMPSQKAWWEGPPSRCSPLRRDHLARPARIRRKEAILARRDPALCSSRTVANPHASWVTALAAERKLAIHDAFHRQKRGVEKRNTARKHGKCFKAATQALVSPPTPMQTASRGSWGSNSSVTAKASRAIVPTGSVAHPQARSSRSSRVPEPGVVAPPGSSAGGVGVEQ